MMRLFAAASFLLLGFAALTTTASLRESTAETMSKSAVAFLDSLDEQQLQVAKLDFAASERVGWHFIPMKTRKGLALRDMNEAQRTAALRLLRSALSESGYSKASQIMLMEQVLRILEGPERTWERDYQKYYVTLFGNPRTAGERWGLSFEGHHLSMNFVCKGDQILDSTPQFFASNPAILKSDVEGAPLKKGTRILADEEQLGFDLLASLSAEQGKKAVIAEEAPADIRAAGEAQPPVEVAAGIAYSELLGDQQKLLIKLIHTYASAMPEEVFQQRLRLIEEANWDTVHFAWAGAKEPGIGHYYRVQGPTFLIEFVNTQPDAEGNPANHIHCVWRDMTGDFDLAVQ